MSQFLPDSFEQSQQRQTNAPPKGPEEYLSPDERRFIQRYLSFPEDIPPKFKSWLIDFIAVNIPQIPISQIVGFKQVEQVEATNAQVLTEQTTTSTSYTDLATTGPSVTGVRNGQYVVIFGYTGFAPAGVGSAASVSVNGAAASDDDWCSQDNAANASTARIVVKTLAAAPNTITVKYRSKFVGTSTYSKRWLVVLRIGS